MKVQLERINEAYLLEAKGAGPVSVFIDNKTSETVKGVSPMELLLMAVGSCNAIDIIYVLKKQRQVVASYKVEVEGTGRKYGKPNLLRPFMLRFFWRAKLFLKRR